MEREEVGDGRAEGSSAIGDGGQAAISLMPDVDGIGSDFLLDSILSTLLEKWSSDAWVVVYQLHHCFYSCFQTCWASCKNTLLYSIQQSTQKHNPLKRMHPQDNVSQTHEPTYSIGHGSASSHLWKFVTWRFVCRGLTVPATSCCLQTDLEPVSGGTSKWAGSQLSGGRQRAYSHTWYQSTAAWLQWKRQNYTSLWQPAVSSPDLFVSISTYLLLLMKLNSSPVSDGVFPSTHILLPQPCKGHYLFPINGILVISALASLLTWPGHFFFILQISEKNPTFFMSLQAGLIFLGSFKHLVSVFRLVEYLFPLYWYLTDKYLPPPHH